MKMKDKLKRHAAVILTALSLTIVNVSIAKSQNITPWLAPKDLANTANPTKPNEITLKDSKKLYNNTCGPCHGDKGKGDGVAAIACNPKPADHTSSALQKESDGSLYWKISTGRGPMPSYKGILTESQRWQLVNYIRTLSFKK